MMLNVKTMSLLLIYVCLGLTNTIFGTAESSLLAHSNRPTVGRRLRSSDAQFYSVKTGERAPKFAVVSNDSATAAPKTKSIYQSRVLKDLEAKKWVFLSHSSEHDLTAGIHLASLIHSGDLERFQVAYVNYHPLQVGLLNEYLKHPDARHRDYVEISTNVADGVHPFEPIMDAIDARRKIDSAAFDQFSFASTELIGQDGGAYLMYSLSEYEYALAAYLVSLFPSDTTIAKGENASTDEQIPARIRPHVEAMRSLVSVGLWSLWEERNNIQVPDYDEEDLENTVQLEVDPEFNAVNTVRLLRDSFSAIYWELENYILPENRENFRLLSPFFRPISQNHGSHRVMVGETFIEQLQKRTDLVEKLKNETRRTLIVGMEHLEQLGVNRYNPKVMPSLMEDLIMAGVNNSEMARVFITDHNKTLNHILLRALADGSDDLTDTAAGNTIYPPLSALSTQDTALSDDPFGMSETPIADTLKLFLDVTKYYEVKDSMNIQTLVLATEPESQDFNANSTDSEFVSLDARKNHDRFDEDMEWGGNGPKRSFMSGKSNEELNLLFDVSYTQIQPIFKPKYLNVMRDVMGLQGGDPLNLMTQGIGIGFNTFNNGFIQNHRLQFTQSIPTTVGTAYSATYAIYSDMTHFPLGRFFSFGLGGFLGFGEQRYKQFTGFSGGFINQEQPSFVVKNPAKLYGLTLEPTIHIGSLFARLTGGYAWDISKDVWSYQNEPMNSGPGFRSTGWYLMGELGFHWKFATIYSDGEYTTVTDTMATFRFKKPTVTHSKQSKSIRERGVQK